MVMVYGFIVKYDSLIQKKRRLDESRPFSPEVLHNLERWFLIELTYTSNALEGNTLTRLETAVVVEKGADSRGKNAGGASGSDKPRSRPPQGARDRPFAGINPHGAYFTGSPLHDSSGHR